jgi:hypothetical protein
LWARTAHAANELGVAADKIGEKQRNGENEAEAEHHHGRCDQQTDSGSLS